MLHLLNHHHHIVEADYQSIDFNHSTAEAEKGIEAGEQSLKGGRSKAEANPF